MKRKTNRLPNPYSGAQIVETILSDETLYKLWLSEVKKMADRIIDMRSKLYDALVKLDTPGEWGHIKSQIGMFSFTGCELPSFLPFRFLCCSGYRQRFEIETEPEIEIEIEIDIATEPELETDIPPLPPVSPEQVAELGEKAHIYMTKDGRISMAGLNDSNVQVSVVVSLGIGIRGRFWRKADDVRN